MYSQGVSNILRGMRSGGARRLAVVSAVPAGPWEHRPFFDRTIVLPILQRFFGNSYADMRRMEALLAACEVEWTALRPPRLVDKAATGEYRIDADKPLPARSLRYADLATALLDSVEREQVDRTTAYIASAA